MAETTISNIKEAKKELQRELNRLIFEFENKHGVGVDIESIVTSRAFDEKIGRKPRKYFGIALNLEDDYEIPVDVERALQDLNL